MLAEPSTIRRLCIAVHRRLTLETIPLAPSIGPVVPEVMTILIETRSHPRLVVGVIRGRIPQQEVMIHRAVATTQGQTILDSTPNRRKCCVRLVCWTVMKVVATRETTPVETPIREVVTPRTQRILTVTVEIRETQVKRESQDEIVAVNHGSVFAECLGRIL